MSVIPYNEYYEIYNDISRRDRAPVAAVLLVMDNTAARFPVQKCRFSLFPELFRNLPGGGLLPENFDTSFLGMAIHEQRKPKIESHIRYLSHETHGHVPYRFS